MSQATSRRERASQHHVMATQDDVRRTVLSLPVTTEDPASSRFFVDGKQFAWAWNERADPKRARVPNPDVVAVRVGNEFEKETLRRAGSAPIWRQRRSG
jgi:predicted NAD/FAD-dependent oxidoreductase